MTDDTKCPTREEVAWAVKWSACRYVGDIAEIHRRFFDVVAERDATIERLTRERDEARAQLVVAPLPPEESR